MLIGNNKKNKSAIISNRSKYSLNYAINKIITSPIKPYISKIYLYGSCARGEQTYKSDVDLFLEIKDNTEIETIKEEIIKLKGTVSPRKQQYPEVDLRITLGTEWKNDNMLFYKNIRRDGIVIWEQE